MVFDVKLRKENKAFSLVEVLLAVVLLGLVVTPLIGTVYTSLSINQKSKKLMAATDCAQTLVEYCEAKVQPDLITEMDDYYNHPPKVVKPYGFVHGTSVDFTSGSADMSAFLNSTYTHWNANSNNSIFFKTTINANEQAYAMTSLTYEGYSFNVFLDIALDTSSYSLAHDYTLNGTTFEVTPREYSIYNVTVEVYDALDPTNRTPITSYSGSIYNKID